jgi:hypothetical protein
MKTFNYLLISFLALSLFSCKCDRGVQLLPNISGKAGEVVIVINKGVWESEAGSTIRKILAADEPFLPQREPMFTLVNIPENAFTSIFQTHRNIVLVNIIKDLPEPKVILQENVWAAPQIVITISGRDEHQIAKLIGNQENRIKNSLLMAERNRNIQNAKRYEEKPLRDAVSRYFGGSPYFPKGYSLKRNTKDFIWISYETTYTNQGIFLYKFPFTDSTDFSIDNLIAHRNDVLQRNVSGQTERSYMTTATQIPPGLTWVQYNKRVFAELRGFWEVQNDFMGGPFISHFFLDPYKQNIIALECFVYAPRYDKRNYLRQVESILYSFEFN